MYKQFNKDIRKNLAILLKAGHTPKKCSELLGFTKRSVNREIKNNKDGDGVYRGVAAHKKYLARRKEVKKKSRKIQNNKPLEKYIRKRLEEKDSPEQICGRINNDLTKKNFPSITCPTIYNWIYTEDWNLTKKLRIIGKKGGYRRKKGTRIREKIREEAKVKRIDERPEEANNRIRDGDWEGDTIIGKNKTTRLLSNVDRRSGYGLLDKLSNVQFEIVHKRLEENFKKIPRRKKCTYTYDNGTEIGKEDDWLEEKIKMDVYRAYPYHSWERGSNENYNGLVRDFLPKGTDFDNIPEEEIRRIQKNLNNRPRKRLNYLTPHEVFVREMDPDEVGRLKF